MKNRIIKLICAVAAIAVLLCSCQQTQPVQTQPQTPAQSSQPEEKIVKITLPYSDADSLNPFVATDVKNLALWHLYCQPLFEVKSDYTVSPVIAEDYEVQGRNINVTLKDVYFSDGSKVTARDVVYSYDMAKAAPAFSQRLATVEDAYMKGERVIFTLSCEDFLGVNLLTFPIVKFGSAWSPEILPVGSGAFIMNEQGNFVINADNADDSSINTVELYNVKKLEYITHELEIGDFNYLFEDFSQGSFKRIVAENKLITLNNIVYLGMNCNNVVLSSAAVRTAICYAIDRQEVAATAFQGYSKAAVTPFNPDLYILKQEELPLASGDRGKCASILSKMGYNYTADSFALTDNTRTLELSILVNSNNSFRTAAAYKIAEELNSQGFLITVESVDFETYSQRIAAGDYCMYMGEMKLKENMDISVFNNPSLISGIESCGKLFESFSLFKKGEMNISDFLDSFYESVPFIPICYRVGVAAYSSAYSPDFSYAPLNIYGNLENWEASK